VGSIIGKIASIAIILLIITPYSINGLDIVKYDHIGFREEIPETLPWYFITVFGDNRPEHSGEVYYNPIFYRIVDEMETLYPHAVIGVGDHVYNGYIDQIEHFIETMKDLPNVWVVAGNHEWNNQPTVNSRNRLGVEYWREHVAKDLYYRDDISGWRIVFINLRAGYPVNENWDRVRAWLVNDAFNTNRHTIVVFHEPVYPRQEASRSIGKVQSKLKPLLIQYRPDIVLQGHIHCYYEIVKYGTLYMITGGAGAPKCHDYPYHYVVFMLKPSGGYDYVPVDAEHGYISVSIKSTYNGYIITIENYKKDIWGRRTSLPIRVKLGIHGETYYLVSMAAYGKTVYNVDIGDNEFEVNTTINNGYPSYIYTLDGQVWISNDDGLIIVRETHSKTTVSEPLSTTTGSETYTHTTINPDMGASGVMGENSIETNGSSTELTIDYGLLGLIVFVATFVVISLYLGRKTS